MTAVPTEIKVKLMDTREVRAWIKAARQRMAELQDRVDELEREADEARRRYDNLLASVGGVSPG